MENINDIINSISDEKLDVVINALVNRKESCLKKGVFETLFKEGHLLEVKYDDNALIYFDRLVFICGKDLEFGIFGTNGESTAWLELDEKDNIAFSKDSPSFSCSYSKISFKKGKFKVNGLTSCKLCRGVYTSNVGGHTPVEHDALKLLAKYREKLNDVPVYHAPTNDEIALEINAAPTNDEIAQEIAAPKKKHLDKIYKAFESMRNFLNENPNRWIYFTRIAEKETSKDGFKSTRKSKISQHVNQIDIDNKTGQVIVFISDSDKVFAFNINDFSADLKAEHIDGKKWALIDTNIKMEFEFFNTSVGVFSKENRIDPISIII